MARNNASQHSSGGKAARPGQGRTRSTTTTAGTASANAEGHENILPEWDEVPEDLTAITDIDGLLGRPSAGPGSDAEARRRIEMLREERLLQQALSDVFEP
jgi:hypothetical protein